MQKLKLTTPLTGRRAELGQKPKSPTTAMAEGKSAQGWNKWTLLRWVAEIKHVLGLNDRSLSLLSALVSFHPETEWQVRHGGEAISFVVFPSNRQLCERAHGMAEKTMRRHLAHLVDAGLILRRDSPNGKRYARRDTERGRIITQAFGFDLSPLLARAEMLERQSRYEQRRRMELAAVKEQISLLRRDLDQALAAASALAEIAQWRTQFKGLLAPVRRIGSLEEARSLASGLEALLREVTGALSRSATCDAVTVNCGQNDRHQSESETEYRFESRPTKKDEPRKVEMSVALVVDACPDLRHFQIPGERIANWTDLLRLMTKLRPQLGVSSDAWEDALIAMGEAQASAALAFVLQRSEFSSDARSARETIFDGESKQFRTLCPVRSPGGYLRRLTAEAQKGSLKLAQAFVGLIERRSLQPGRGVVL